MANSLKWLVLVPTDYEIQCLSKTALANTELCGFGPIAASARTTFLICQSRPENILLLGIAGGFDKSLVATALEFGSVVCDGVGVGEGEGFQSAAEIGWSHWSQENPSLKIEDEIQLAAANSSHRLLTVCSASADAAQATRRQQRYSVAAEDMEGFGVAMACRMAGVPLRIVRGISNVVGDRDKANWKVKEALAAAEDLAVKIIEDAQ